MMEIYQKNKKLIISVGAGAVALGLLIVFLTTGGGGAGDPLAEVSIDPTEELLGRELLLSLQKMKSVKLDLSLLSDDVYLSLKDTSSEIPKQKVGRRNPFAPFGENSTQEDSP